MASPFSASDLIALLSADGCDDLIHSAVSADPASSDLLKLALHRQAIQQCADSLRVVGTRRQRQTCTTTTTTTTITTTTTTTTTTTLYQAAFAAGLDDILQRFAGDIADAEASVLDDPAFTPQHLRYLLRAHLPVFPRLATFAMEVFTSSSSFSQHHTTTRSDSVASASASSAAAPFRIRSSRNGIITPLQGGVLLDALYHQSMDGDPYISSVFSALLHRVHQPFFAQLTRWMAYAELDDGDDEVEEDDDDEEEEEEEEDFGEESESSGRQQQHQGSSRSRGRKTNTVYSGSRRTTGGIDFFIRHRQRRGITSRSFLQSGSVGLEGTNYAASASSGRRKDIVLGGLPGASVISSNVIDGVPRRNNHPATGSGGGIETPYPELAVHGRTAGVSNSSTGSLPITPQFLMFQLPSSSSSSFPFPPSSSSSSFPFPPSSSSSLPSPSPLPHIPSHPDEEVIRLLDRAASEYDWARAFALQYDAIPVSYFPESLAETVLAVGKAVGLLLQHGRNGKKHQPNNSNSNHNKNKNTGNSKHQSKSELIGFSREDSLAVAQVLYALRASPNFSLLALQTVIHRVRDEVFQRLWRLLVSPTHSQGGGGGGVNILAHVRNVRSYFLLGRGDFWQAFLEQSRRLMSSTPASSSNALSMLHAGPWEAAAQQAAILHNPLDVLSGSGGGGGGSSPNHGYKYANSMVPSLSSSSSSAAAQQIITSTGPSSASSVVTTLTAATLTNNNNNNSNKTGGRSNFSTHSAKEDAASVFGKLSLSLTHRAVRFEALPPRIIRVYRRDEAPIVNSGNNVNTNNVFTTAAASSDSDASFPSLSAAHMLPLIPLANAAFLSLRTWLPFSIAGAERLGRSLRAQAQLLCLGTSGVISLRLSRPPYANHGNAAARANVSGNISSASSVISAVSSRNPLDQNVTLTTALESGGGDGTAAEEDEEEEEAAAAARKEGKKIRIVDEYWSDKLCLARHDSSMRAMKSTKAMSGAVWMFQPTVVNKGFCVRVAVSFPSYHGIINNNNNNNNGTLKSATEGSKGVVGTNSSSSTSSETASFALVIHRDNLFALGNTFSAGSSNTTTTSSSNAGAGAGNTPSSTSSSAVVSAGYTGIANSLVVHVLVKRLPGTGGVSGNTSNETIQQNTIASSSSSSSFRVVVVVYGPPSANSGGRFANNSSASSVLYAEGSGNAGSGGGPPPENSTNNRPLLASGAVMEIRLPSEGVYATSGRSNTPQSTLGLEEIITKRLQLSVEYVPPGVAISASTVKGSRSASTAASTLNKGRLRVCMLDTEAVATTPTTASAISSQPTTTRLIIDAPLTIEEHINFAGVHGPGRGRAWVGLTADAPPPPPLLSVLAPPPPPSSSSSSSTTSVVLPVPVWLECLDSISYAETDESWAGLFPTYSVPAPAHLILHTGAFGVYEDVFRLGLRAKAVSLGLQETWRHLMDSYLHTRGGGGGGGGRGGAGLVSRAGRVDGGTSIDGGISSSGGVSAQVSGIGGKRDAASSERVHRRLELQRMLQPIWLLRARMQFVVDALLYHLQVDVIESAHAKFEEAASAASEYGALQAAHDTFLRTLLEGAFLTQPSVGACVSRLLTHCERFIASVATHATTLPNLLTQLVTSISGSGSGGVEGSLSASSSSSPKTVLEELSAAFEADVRYLETVGGGSSSISGLASGGGTGSSHATPTHNSMMMPVAGASFVTPGGGVGGGANSSGGSASLLTRLNFNSYFMP